MLRARAAGGATSAASGVNVVMVIEGEEESKSAGCNVFCDWVVQLL
jgi:hypothetical protein